MGTLSKENDIGVRQKFLFLPDVVLFIDVLALFLLIGLACFYISYPEGDQAEHLYASFRVSLGEVPYRDFFEHHNPLLWYIMAPLLRLMERNLEVLGWACYLTFLFFVWGLFFVYRITAEFFNAGRVAGLMTIVVLLVPGVFLYYVYFRPDNWMFTCLSGGCYFYFKYLRDKCRRDLVFSYLFFVTAFLFLQKALFFYPVIGGATLYALYKKEMRWKDFGLAVLPCLLILAAWGVYFSFHGGLALYFNANFLFNSGMAGLIDSYRISSPGLMVKFVLVLAFILVLALYKSGNRYFRLWDGMFLMALLPKIFYFSPHIYYWYEAYYFAVPVGVTGLMRFAGKRKKLLWAIILELQLYAGLMGYYIYNDVVHKPKLIIPSEREFIIANTNRCDSVLLPGIGNTAVFNKILGYYGFLYGQIDVLGARLGIHEVEDLNKLVEKQRPKLLLVNKVYERYPKIKGAKNIIHEPDMELIEKMYEPTERVAETGGFDFETMTMRDLGYKRGIWKLKPEYRQKNCRYDTASGWWKYEEN